MLTQFDLNRLHIFFHVYKENSIVRAAERLNITRSAVSQHVKKCEKELGATLFTRQHTRLIATHNAKRLYTALEPLFQEIEFQVNDIRKGRGEPSGLLRIGAPLEFGKIYLPRIIGEFRQKHKLVTFSLSLGDSESLIEQVREGELDFSLIDLFLVEEKTVSYSSAFDIKPVYSEEVVMICSSLYFQEKMKGGVSLENLMIQDYITYRQNNLVVRTWFKHHYKKRPLALSIVFTVDNVRAVVSAVENHIGLGVVPYHVVSEKILNGSIVAINTRKSNIVNNISLLQLQDKIPGLAEKAFVNFFNSKIAQGKAVFME